MQSSTMIQKDLRPSFLRMESVLARDAALGSPAVTSSRYKHQVGAWSSAAEEGEACSYPLYSLELTS